MPILNGELGRVWLGLLTLVQLASQNFRVGWVEARMRLASDNLNGQNADSTVICSVN